MSYIITAIISMIFGAGIMACMAMSGRCSEQERTAELMRTSYNNGFRAGMKLGKLFGRRDSERVDVAPGPDSIRTEVTK